jgi:hypothetical protein
MNDKKEKKDILPASILAILLFKLSPLILRALK